MLKPFPSFKKCIKCGKSFLAKPKSDALNALDFICFVCKYKEYNLSYLLRNLTRNFKIKNKY
ncbi:hypothetical protein C3H36_03600 [Campylobacter jejuni]|uniref:hypothetical protein n=1 Tax=Campylobacter jejuni TaxID=197 RepID=UPI000F7FFC95|nr:hypothetical protein [Campylobacter jejuni]RTK00221.1 hypothetical protein C3H36_03600 [Campylobacter jejuni]